MIGFLVATLIVHSVNCAFFDMTDIDDPLALLWNTKAAINTHMHKNCTVSNADGTSAVGVCKHASHCWVTGGKPQAGSCGLFSSCCIYEQESCSKTTSSKVSYFESGQNLQGNARCKYIVNLENSNICQVRLDFELFRMTEAKQLISRLSPKSFEYKCEVDYLKVSPNNYGIPKFCGYNDKQHVYIHIDSTIKQVQLDAVIGNRINSEGIINPEWRIKITQLECLTPAHHLLKHDFHQAVADYDMLAPVGAIQYFREMSGNIRSFGLNLSRPEHMKHSFTTSEFYTIAFKRYPNVCKIRFTSNYMKLNPVKPVPVEEEDSCQSYLFIPGLIIKSDPKPIAKICGLKPTGFVFISQVPGPYYINFKSSSVDVLSPTDDWGFDLTYDLRMCE